MGDICYKTINCHQPCPMTQQAISPKNHPMLKEQEILHTIDNANKLGSYCHFIWLGDVYSHLIDCRLNVFRNANAQWVVAMERLGYNPRAGSISLQIFYYGNCLINLREYNGQFTNYYMNHPIDEDNFEETLDGECLKPKAEYWLIRGEKVPLSHDLQDYIRAGIPLDGYPPGEISVQMAGRLIAPQYGHLLRATDQELYKSIPADLEKILVLDEWYHRDFNETIQPAISDEHLKQAFEMDKKLREQLQMDFDGFTDLFREQEKKNQQYNQTQWIDNRPGSYETWQQLASVIATGDINHYKPSLEPTTHWKYHPDSGSL